MNLKAFKDGILLITLSIFCTNGIIQANNRNTQVTNQPNSNDNTKKVQALESFLNDSEYKSKAANQQLASILAICFCDFNIKGHFSKFVKILISFLENQEHAAQLKAKYPSLNIAAIIAALKKVENDTSAVQIVLKLKNYISLFPEEFKNMLPAELVTMNALAFRSAISQRLQDKS